MPKLNSILIIVLFLFSIPIIVPSLVHSQEKEVPSGRIPRADVVLLSDQSFSQSRDRNYRLSLGAIGFPPVVVDLAHLPQLELDQMKALMIPSEIAKNLPSTFVNAIIVEVQNGLRVYVEGDSPLSRALGIQYNRPESRMSNCCKCYGTSSALWS